MIKRLALVANEAWNIYNFRADLILGLIKLGYEVITIAPTSKKYDVQLEELGARVVNVKMDANGTNPVKDIKLISDLKKIYVEYQIDLTFNYTIKPLIYGSIAAKLAGIKSIAVATGLGYAFINKNPLALFVQMLTKFSVRYPQKIWFLNESDRCLFVRKGIVEHSKTFVLNGEGINTNIYKTKSISPALERKKLIFIMIARVLWDKGVKEYFEAARQIKKRFPETEFQLLGTLDSTNHAAVPESYVKKHVDEGIINYLGEVDNVIPIMEQADALVLPSYREGISRVIMEAASTGKPVVASEVPGCQELIENGVTGFLCEVKNIDSLVNSLETFLQMQSEERFEMGKAGRLKMIREFSIDKIISTYQEEISKII